MKRVSFIDLGSNSVRFVIIEINENGSYQLIYQQKRVSDSVRICGRKISSLKRQWSVQL